MPGRSTVVLIVLALVGCRGSHEDLEGIDWPAWKEDQNGCSGRRISYLNSVHSQREKLKARSEMEIVELMGRPDETELYKRNQKFYTYYFANGPGCTTVDSIPRKLVIRFNAVGLAKEVVLE